MKASLVTPEYVAERVATIDRSKGDDEGAHGIEDSLYRTILAAIAAGTCVEPAECSRIALTSQDIDFARWCA